MRFTALAAALCLGCAIPVRAQTPPPRPHLARDADTNSAMAYINHGMEALRRDPQTAAADFYWAARLQPTWSQPKYARAIAILISDPLRLRQYVLDDEGTLQRPEIREADSLYVEASIIEPFLEQSLEPFLLKAYWDVELRSRYGPQTDETDLQRYFLAVVRDDDLPDIKGLYELANGDVIHAMRDFTTYVRSHPRTLYGRIYLARTMVQMGRPDSAASRLREALALAGAQDTLAMALVYHSKEFMKYMLGVALEKAGDTTAAQQAFQDALVENLGFWGAHVHLGTLAMARHDTAQAIRELQAAVEARETDYTSRMQLALAFGVTGRLREAVPHLVRATQLEPFAASPWNLLGKVYDAAGRRAEAADAYQHFVDLCQRDHPERPAIVNRIAALRAAPPTQ